MKDQIYTLVLLLFLCCLAPGAKLSAQVATPGGVKGLTYWFAVSEDGTGFQWREQSGKHAVTINPTPTQVKWLNGHPVLGLDAASEPISLTIPASTWAQSTLISLFQVRDTFQEQIIWRVAQPKQTGVILSTARLGDVTKGRYFNAPQPPTISPILHSYVQHQSPDRSHPTVDWLIGHQGKEKKLPIVDFSGQLPVFLLYDRVLSQEEQLRINSHLALQYGISLPRTNYLNADGEVIWDVEKNQDFPHRITGLGYDPVSGLHQKRSSSQMEAEALLDLSVGGWTSSNAANVATIPAGRFLIWSDNGARLRFEKPTPHNAQPILLERKWLMDATQQVDDIPTEMRFHSRRLESLLKEEEQLWLLIDESGEGEFAFDQTRYYQGKRGGNGMLTFTDVQWDIDASGKDLFTFALGDPFLAAIDVKDPTCTPEQRGEIRLRLLGGQAPYAVSWKTEDGTQVQSWQMNEGQIRTWSDITAGAYHLEVTDAKGQRLRRKLQIQQKDAPPISLASSYRLSPGQPLVLDLETPGFEQAEYEWKGPDGEISYGPALSIQAPGNYQVQASLAGCVRLQILQVLPPLENFIEEWQLFPNPVSLNKDFELRLSLDQERSLEVRLIDAQGKTLQVRALAKAAFHTYINRLPAAGTYQLLIRAGKQHFSLPIIAQ